MLLIRFIFFFSRLKIEPLKKFGKLFPGPVIFRATDSRGGALNPRDLRANRRAAHRCRPSQLP